LGKRGGWKNKKADERVSSSSISAGGPSVILGVYPLSSDEREEGGGRGGRRGTSPGHLSSEAIEASFSRSLREENLLTLREKESRKRQAKRAFFPCRPAVFRGEKRLIL